MVYVAKESRESARDSWHDVQGTSKFNMENSQTFREPSGQEGVSEAVLLDEDGIDEDADIQSEEITKKELLNMMATMNQNMAVVAISVASLESSLKRLRSEPSNSGHVTKKNKKQAMRTRMAVMFYRTVIQQSFRQLWPEQINRRVLGFAKSNRERL